MDDKTRAERPIEIGRGVVPPMNLTPDIEPAGPLGVACAAARLRTFAAQCPALAEFQGEPARPLVVLDFHDPVHIVRCSPNSSPTTSRSSSTSTARTSFRSSSPIPTPILATISAPRPIIAIPICKNSSTSITPSKSGRRSASPTRPSTTGRLRHSLPSRPGCSTKRIAISPPRTATRNAALWR